MLELTLSALVDREATHRHQRRLKTRLQQAGFQQHAAFEDVDFKSPRGLDKALLLTLASCQWIEQHHNCLITGPTGVGKSWIATALAHKACREGYTARYLRLPASPSTYSLPKATAAIPLGSNSSPASMSSSSTTGDFPPSMKLDNATSWRSWMTDSIENPPSSPASFLSPTGMTFSATPPWPTPFSIALSTMLTRYN